MLNNKKASPYTAQAHQVRNPAKTFFKFILKAGGFILCFFCCVVLSIDIVNSYALSDFEGYSLILLLFGICIFVYHILKSILIWIRRKKKSLQLRQARVCHPYYRRHRHISLRAASIICILSVITLSSLAYHAYVQAAIPDSLIEFKEKYPETASFVNSYSKEHNKHHNMDISGEVKKGVIPTFLQWDKRWGYQQYGDNFLAITGCGPTSLSMVYSGLTGKTDKNPYQMARFAENNHYYIDGQGSSWDLMTKGAEKIGLHSVQENVSSQTIRSDLSRNLPIICSMYPGDFTTSGHFLVLVGVDTRGNIILHDPNSLKNTERHWNINRLLPQIHAMWSFRV